MLEFICLFFPAFLSLAIFRKIKSPRLVKGLENTLISYGAFTFVNTIITLLIMKLLFRGVQTSVEGGLAPAFVSVSYLLVALVVSLITGICARLLSEFIKIRLDEVEK